MLKPIKELLPKKVSKGVAGSELLAARVLDVWREESKSVTSLSHSSKALAFRRGVLTVLVESSSLAGALALKERSLVNLLNRRLGKPLVKRVLFKID